MSKKIIDLIDTYDPAKHTEIENKYNLTEEGYNKAKAVLESGSIKDNTYLQKDKSVEKEQIDYYYDTPEFALAKSGYSLRCRNINGKHIFTLKKPGNVGTEENESQFIRLEFEYESEHDSLDENVMGFLKMNNWDEEIKRDGKTIEYADLQHIVTIRNTRSSYNFQHKGIADFKCEVSLDDVTYYRHGEENGDGQKDYQIEIELKCNSIYRVTLNKFAEELCNEIGEESLVSSKSNYSKYETALKMLRLCQIERKHGDN